MPFIPGSKHEYKRGPGHFIVRDTGEVVPLIPVDELPVGFDIVCVPRNLDLTATVGMINLGLVRNTGNVYELVGKGNDRVNIQGGTRTRAPGAITELSNDINSTSITPRISVAHSIIRPTASRQSAMLQHARNPTPSGQMCKYWCMYGFCKWGQQCRHQHTMPMTLSGLQAAGLTDWPVWYQSMSMGRFCSPAPTSRLQSGHGRATAYGLGICGQGIYCACSNSMNCVHPYEWRNPRSVHCRFRGPENIMEPESVNWALQLSQHRMNAGGEHRQNDDARELARSPMLDRSISGDGKPPTFARPTRCNNRDGEDESRFVSQAGISRKNSAAETVDEKNTKLVDV